MSSNVVALLVAASLGQFPFLPGGGPGPGSSQYGTGAVSTAPDSTQAFGTGEPTNPYDFEPNWAHGYYQEVPAYGGYHFFRPYNYKHVMPQAQVSAAWGNSPNMPYSHQYFDKVSGHPTVFLNQPSNVARSNQDLRTQLANVDRAPRARSQRRQGPPALVQLPPRHTVSPAGHRSE